MADASERLARLLGLVPYLTRNPGTGIATTANVFGITPAQLIDDLELLFVSGRPGHMPDDLIEANWEGDRIYVANADEVSVPVRLSSREARALLIALDYLAEVDDVEPATIARVRAKVSAAAALSPAGGAVDVRVPERPAALQAALAQARARGEGLALDYYVAARDELTHRLVTPKRLRLAGAWYLDAWCHTSGGPRTFAVPAIRGFASAPVPEVPAGAATGAGSPRDEGLGVALTFTPEAAWLADELETTAVDYDAAGPGTVRAQLRVHSREWLTRLLLAHGRHVLAVEPPGLAADAARIAAQAAGRVD